MRRFGRWLLVGVGSLAAVVLILDVVTASWTALVGDLIIVTVALVMGLLVSYIVRRRRR